MAVKTIRVINRPTRVSVVDKGVRVKVVSGGPTGEEGPAGPPGPQGPPGVSGGVYVHDQVVASATWTITHNLGVFPNVTTVDTAGTYIQGGVNYVSANQVIVTFSTPLSGKAYLS